MSGSPTVVDYGSGGRLSTEESSGGQRCMPDDSLMDMRSCGQVENGTPSTSPPYWDTDDEDDDGGMLLPCQSKFAALVALGHQLMTVYAGKLCVKFLQISAA